MKPPIFLCIPLVFYGSPKGGTTLELCGNTTAGCTMFPGFSHSGATAMGGPPNIAGWLISGLKSEKKKKRMKWGTPMYGNHQFDSHLFWRNQMVCIFVL